MSWDPFLKSKGQQQTSLEEMKGAENERLYGGAAWHGDPCRGIFGEFMSSVLSNRTRKVGSEKVLASVF